MAVTKYIRKIGVADDNIMEMGNGFVFKINIMEPLTYKMATSTLKNIIIMTKLLWDFS